MEEGHGHAVACGGVCDREGFVKPDTVFGARAASITALHMAVAKARIQTYPQRPPITRCHQLVEHVRGADVGQHPIVADDVQGIIPEHVGREHDLGDCSPQGIPSGLGAQHFIARDRIDPDLVRPHARQHWRCGAGFHGITCLQARRRRQGHDRVDSGLDHCGVIHIKGCADALSQPAQIGTLQGICSHA